MCLNLILPMLALVCCQTNVWNGIVPLKSTKEDVEKILGKPTLDSIAQAAAEYRTKDGKVFVLYSTGPCKVKPSNGWKIPKQTVISISFYPVDRPQFTDLQIDMQKFERHSDPEILHLIDYTNKTEGINLTIDESDGSVTRFSYFPESKYDYLKCKATKE